MTLYDLAKKIFRFQFRLMGWKTQGLENMPSEGPVILAINHNSFWDSIVAASSISRRVYFMAKAELFSIPILGRILLKLGAFPVRREQGDMNAIRQALGLLKDGRVLGLFPDMARPQYEAIQKGLPGMVLLMEKSKASVVPIKVYGTRRLLIKGWGNLAVVVGKPLTAEMLKVPEGVGNRREWVADRITEAMSELSEAN